MEPPTASQIPSPTPPLRNTFRTAGDVVHHVGEIIKTSVLGLNDLALRPDVSERERLTLRSLAALRLRATKALTEPSGDWAEKFEKTWTQYPVVFQVALTLQSDLSRANTALEANELLSHVDQTLIAALLAMKEGNPAVAEFCESIADVIFQMERQGSIVLNGEQDM